MGAIRPNQIVRIPLWALEEPYDGMNDVHLNRWWTYDREEQSIIFYKMHKGATLSAQCNSNEGLARKIQESAWPDFSLKFVPQVFLPQTSWQRGGEYYTDVSIGRVLKRIEEQKNTWQMAECANCEPPLPMPFKLKSERDDWAKAHSTTGHRVRVYTEVRGG